MRLIMVPLIVFLGLSACSSVVMTTAAVLGMENPLAADPADYAVSITIPEGVDVKENGARLILRNVNTLHDVKKEDTYILERNDVEDARTIFRIDPADYATLRAYQTRITAWEKEDSSANSGSLSIFVEFCLRGDGPADDDIFNVGIRTKPDGRFMPLIHNAKVKDAIEKLEVNGGSIREFRRCAQ